MKVKVLVTQLCLTLYNPKDCSPLGFSVDGILLARILEWVAIPFSRDLPEPGVDSRLSELRGKTYICVCVYIHTHTHTHTHIGGLQLLMTVISLFIDMAGNIPFLEYITISADFPSYLARVLLVSFSSVCL